MVNIGYLTTSYEDRAALIQTLKGMGTSDPWGKGEWSHWPIVGIEPNGALNTARPYEDSFELIGNKDAFISLVKQKESGEFQEGEILVLESNQGLAAKAGTLAVCRGHKGKYTFLDWLNDTKGQQNGSYTTTDFRRATKEEIINFYSNKSKKMSTNKSLVPGYETASEEDRTSLLAELQELGIKMPVAQGSWESYPVVYVYEGKRSNTSARCHTRPRITRDELLKLASKRPKGRLVGYKAPKAMFEGSVPVGELYTTRSTEPHVYRCNGSYPMPKEIVEDWEAVYETLFEIGDKVLILENTNGSVNRKGDIGTIIEFSETGHSGAHYLVEVEGISHQNSGWTMTNEMRLATPEEIDAFGSIEIKGYRANVANGRVNFGCQEFSKQQLETLQDILGRSGMGYSFKVDDFEVTPSILRRLIAKLG